MPTSTLRHPLHPDGRLKKPGRDLLGEGAPRRRRPLRPGTGGATDAAAAAGRALVRRRAHAGLDLEPRSAPAARMRPGPSLDVLLLGATGTAGRGAARALERAGHGVTAVLRPGSPVPPELARAELPHAELLRAELAAPGALAAAIKGRRFDALVSCLASRTGAPRDAWAIDHAAHRDALRAAERAGIERFVLVSAICVQRPRLAFQHAKLAFEAELAASRLDWTVVRPTALMKSLSGQLARVRRGRPFLVFGDGRLTATKPISADELGRFLAACLLDPSTRGRVLPIGGPGPALTPRDQAGILAELLGRRVRLRRVPPALLAGAARALALTAPLRPAMAEKAELARIGHYYATQSMLVLDPATGRPDADATPETGRTTLREHYAALLGGRDADLREHAVFDAPGAGGAAAPGAR